MARPEIHTWRSRNHGRRRKLSGKHRFGRQDWVLGAALVAGVTLPAVIVSFRPPPPRHATIEHAVITDGGTRALGTYEGSPLELSIITDNSKRLVRARFYARDGKPPPAIRSLTFLPQRNSSALIGFAQTADGLVSTRSVDALEPGAVLTVTGSHRHRVILGGSTRSAAAPQT